LLPGTDAGTRRGELCAALAPRRPGSGRGAAGARRGLREPPAPDRQGHQDSQQVAPRPGRRHGRAAPNAPGTIRAGRPRAGLDAPGQCLRVQPGAGRVTAARPFPGEPPVREPGPVARGALPPARPSAP